MIWIIGRDRIELTWFKLRFWCSRNCSFAEKMLNWDLRTEVKIIPRPELYYSSRLDLVTEFWGRPVPSPWISFPNFTFEYLVLLVSNEKLRSVDKWWIFPFFGWFPISSGFPAFLSDTLTDQQVVANVLLSVLSALTSDWSREVFYPAEVFLVENSLNILLFWLRVKILNSSCLEV